MTKSPEEENQQNIARANDREDNVEVGYSEQAQGDLKRIEDIVFNKTLEVLIKALDEAGANSFDELKRMGKVPTREDLYRIVQDELIKHNFPNLERFYADEKDVEGNRDN